jgi:hypothetical protein
MTCRIAKMSGIPPQSQQWPGLESRMVPAPIFDKVFDEYQQEWVDYKASGQLQGCVALITGGDSGIGKCKHAIVK